MKLRDLVLFVIAVLVGWSLTYQYALIFGGN